MLLERKPDAKGIRLGLKDRKYCGNGAVTKLFGKLYGRNSTAVVVGFSALKHLVFVVSPGTCAVAV